MAPAGQSVGNAASRLASSRSLQWSVVTAWFLLSFAVYMSNGRTLGSGDTVPASLIPITVLLDGTVLLDRFAEEEDRRFPHHHWLVETRRGRASFYPVATGILATPIYAIPVLYQQWRQPLSVDAWRDLAVGTYQKYAAALIVAFSVVIFWSICLELGLSLSLAALLTVLYAFGSEAFAVASQGLWQHGPGSLAFLCAIRSFLVLEKRPRAAGLLLGLFVGLSIAIRPTNFVLIAPLFLAGLYRRPGIWHWMILPAFFLIVSVAGYNEYVFGNLLGGYGLVANQFSIHVVPSALTGSLFSPARGLFVYFPAALLGPILILRRPTLWRNPLVLALVAGVALLTGLISGWWGWDGGHCFGPRYFTEAQGPILISAGLAIRNWAPRPSVIILCVAVILPYSIFVQFMGAFSTATITWSSVPTGEEWKRLWDFNDNPIFRGIRANLG